jgi:uncharacterized protein YegJ (DUF2314 family)
MVKLIAQLVTAFAISVVAWLLGLHWIGIVLLVLIGFVIVHAVYERLFPDPFDYIGTMAVRNDDPLMLAAEEKARTTLDRFLAELYSEHAQDSMVKFSYTNADGEIEKIWGDLLSYRDGKADVYVRTLPLAPKPDFESRMTVDISDIVDWSVEMRDGTLRGGFSNLALFKIYEREEGRMHPRFIPHVERFKDIDG